MPSIDDDEIRTVANGSYAVHAAAEYVTGADLDEALTAITLWADETQSVWRLRAAARCIGRIEADIRHLATIRRHDRRNTR